MNIIEKYKERKETAFKQSQFFAQRVRLLSYIRLAIIAIVIFLLFKHEHFSGIVLTGLVIILLIAFGIVVKVFLAQKFQRDLNTTIGDINEREINYLENNELDFDDGQHYLDTHHEYSYDLDIFGKSSLFQHLNRTQSYIGHKTLGNSLIEDTDATIVKQKQTSISELEGKLEWRQNFLALTELQNGSEKDYKFLTNWALDNTGKISNLINILSYVLPVIFIIAFISNIFLDLGMGNVVTLLFIVNLSVLGSQMKLINHETNKSTKLNKVLYNYGFLIDEIENQNWQSPYLQDLKNKLSIGSNVKANLAIKQLSALFGNMDTINNAVGAALVNGTVLYHIHQLRKLLQWKKENGQYIKDWLSIIGQFESLISFANFKQNNSKYTFPEINNQRIYTFKDLGHPLISNKNRVASDVRFDDYNFIVLTGSNMSGKSTFLRSLGVNIVLAKTGSVICSTQANVDMLDLRVSMRSTDSLSENESYFFAEVKRLQSIMQHAQKQPCFILLDEILRGTNSDDKRNGTIKFIEKLIQHNAIGAIATHDLEVCNTTDKYPEYLTNKCFEVDIKNDQLIFDYTLRDGICQNQSATFLMEKNGII